jgi:vitamin B12 transporter
MLYGGLGVSRAQSDSVQSLPEFVLEASRKGPGELAMQSRFTDLSAQLNAASLNDIRSNSPGALSTLSFRGGSAAQTTVQWNGIPIESPTNGIADLALIPSFLFDAMELSGRSSQISGPGAISGVLELHSRNTPTDRFLLSGMSESFGLLQGGADWSQQIKSVKNRTRVFYLDHPNTFRYEGFRGVEQFQQHAARQAKGLMQNNSWTWGKTHFQIGIWWQQFEREIPPTMLEATSAKFQVDRNLRASFKLQRSLGKGELQGDLGYAREFLHYEDSLSNLNEDYTSDFFLMRLRYRTASFKQMRLAFFLEDRYAKADASDYYRADRNEFSPVIHWFWKERSWRASASTRMSFYLDQRSPLLYTVDAGWTGKDQQISFSISRNYRLPTMNDLFWNPGGDPTLGPEESHRLELNHALIFGHVRWSSTAYFHKIDHQLQWLPDPQTGLFRATQFETATWNRGIQTQILASDTLRVWIVETRLGTQVLKSTLNDALPGLTEGRQQSFIPSIRFNWGLRISWNQQVHLDVGGRYVGTRYLLSDHSRSLDPFSLWNASVAYTPKSNWNIEISAFNLLATSYFLIEYRPMPLRNFNVKLNYRLKTTKKK